MAAAELYYGAQLEYPSGWSFSPHTHRFYQLFCFTAGRCVFTLNGTPQPLTAGDCLLVPPGAAHGLLNVTDPPVSVHELMFVVPDEALAAQLGTKPAVTRPQPLTLALISELSALSLTRLPEAKAYLAAALETLVRRLSPPLSGAGDDPLKLNAQLIDVSGLSPLSAGVVRYIDRHYAENLPLDRLAHDLNYNKSYICTTFRNDCGFTVNDYLNLVRITRAVEYLSYTTSDIAGICAHVGFRNVPHFNRTFKKMLGEPPGHLRRLARINLNAEALYQSFRDTPFHSDLRALASRIYTVQELDAGPQEM